MAFNVGITSKEAFRQLKQLTPKKRVDAVSGPNGVSMLSMLTPVEFAELFPNYYKRGLPDVSGFREAVSRMSRQKQDDINFGLSQGAKSLEEAEQMGTWRRRFGNTSDGETVSSTLNGPRGKFSAANYVAILKQAGFSQKDAVLMAAVGMQESNGNVGAHNDANPNRERSYGLFQININAHKFGSPELEYAGVKTLQDLYDPIKNAKVAYYLYYKGGGIHHWGGYTDGGYRKYLSAAEAAAGTPAGIPSVSGTQNFDTVSNVSSKSGGFFGNDEQCVALSKHFSGLGAASGWKVKSGNITPGTVIATMSYNDGSGGKMARNMPDGKSHYHTGIALSTPNEKGEVLILEQFAGQPARVRSVNINNYNGESWGVVEGGGPSAGTMKAVEIGRGLANPDQLAWIQSSTGQTAAQKGQPSIEVKPAQEAGVAKPTLTTNQVPPQYPEDQQQQAPAQSAKVEKPDKSKKTSETYKFDPDKYWKEVVTKQPMADSMLYGKDKVMQETYKGFQEAQDAGAIKWNRKTNEIQILDPNHEKIQQIYQDMQNNNIDRNAFLSKTEAGDGGTAKVGHVKRNRAAGAVDRYSPDVTLTGLSKDSNLIDYSNSKAAKAIGVTDQQYNAFREALASIESSGGKYGLRGGSSKRFSGAYQIGGRELQEVAKRLGEEAPVMKVKGKKTPVASEQFLKDPHMQERYFDEYVTMHHERLMKNKRYAALSPEEKLKIQGMAHNAGAGAASRYLRTGSISRDAAGTHPEKYAHRIGTQLAGLNSARETAIASSKQTTPQAGPAPTTPMTATAAVTPTEPETAVADRSVSDRMRAAVSPLIGPPAATAAPKKEERQPTGAIDTAPSDFVMPAATTPPAAKSDQHSMLMEKPQNPVSINPLEQRPAHMQPTPSMARAMDNARGVVNTSYTSLSKTNLG